MSGMMRSNKFIILLLLILCLPFLGGWTSVDYVETAMREVGFKLKKKENVNIPYTDRKETVYVFTHRIHRTVIVNDYHNGFIGIHANYRSGAKEENKWHLSINRTVESSAFRDTIYRVFVMGDNK
jgi:hypothetical protein